MTHSPTNPAQGVTYDDLHERLAERGGLSVVEAVVVLLDKPLPVDRGFTPARLAEYRRILMQIIRDFEAGRAALKQEDCGNG